MSALKVKPVVNPRTRELTRRSLQKLINQLKEEIVRFEAGTAQNGRRQIENDQQLENTKDKLRGPKP